MKGVPLVHRRYVKEVPFVKRRYVKGVPLVHRRYVKGVPFVHRRYTNGGPFLSKMVYKRVRGWTSGRNLPVLDFVENPRDFNLC